MYDVLGGQRRYLAIGQLREAGNKKYDEVPCTVVNPQNIDLPVDDETKYLYVIATTNDYRDLTDGDKLLRIRQLSEAVSYTHLDVYKRQALKRWARLDS